MATKPWIRESLVGLMAACCLGLLSACDSPLGQGSHTTGFDAHRVLRDDRTVRLLVLDSGVFEALDVAVRSESDELGLSVRLRDFDAYTDDLVAHCVQTTLPEPVAGRRIVSDAEAFSDKYPHTPDVLEANRALAAGTQCESVGAVER